MSHLMLFRCPGEFIWEGMAHDRVIVLESEAAEYIADGWHRTVYAAHDALEAVTIAAPISRDEIIEKAEALGIKIDRRWSDARLQDEIEKALSSGVE